jgi:hypothetical protein
VLVVVAIASAGCASSGSRHHTEPTTTEPAVPWTQARPPQLADRAAVARRCRAADLGLPDQVKFGPRLNGGITVVTLRNVGRHTCRLAGRPRVRFVHKIPPAQVQKAVPPAGSSYPEVTYPGSSLLALRPGEFGAFTVTWDNWCDPKIPGKKRVPPQAIRVTLPDGGGSLDTDYNAVPPCLDPSRPSSIGVSVFQPTPVRPRRPWTSAFIAASIPGRPLRARRGGVLRFRVVLANRSKVAATFDRCPAYIQELAPAGRPEVYSLNCRKALPIPPGGSRAFAMRLTVPPRSPLGHNGLFWTLDPFGQGGPGLNVRVDVRR